MNMKIRSDLKTIDTIADKVKIPMAITSEISLKSETVDATTSKDENKVQETIVIHPDIRLNIPVSYKKHYFGT